MSQTFKNAMLNFEVARATYTRTTRLIFSAAEEKFLCNLRQKLLALMLLSMKIVQKTDLLFKPQSLFFEYI